ncbi:unnamed protein product [Dracunculus medinensis]|uniref:Phosphoribosyl-ATP diphosphatase n=1 Tax=Dracunculus medinensis TaxID=318479 RepID=A0A0N4U0E8_DRAME|nr:unnamed protein product [Dracunculus medinensis]
MFKERAENAMYDMIEKSDWMLHVITGLKLMGNLTASVKYGKYGYHSVIHNETMVGVLSSGGWSGNS